MIYDVYFILDFLHHFIDRCSQKAGFFLFSVVHLIYCWNMNVIGVHVSSK